MQTRNTTKYLQACCTVQLHFIQINNNYIDLLHLIDEVTCNVCKHAHAVGRVRIITQDETGVDLYIVVVRIKRMRIDNVRQCKRKQSFIGILTVDFTTIDF